jgi:hypothetical protein
LDCASITKKGRVHGAKNTETQNTGIWTAVYFLIHQGLYRKMTPRRGIGRPIRNKRARFKHA